MSASGAEKCRAQTCAPPDHLPELRLGKHLFEEHKVYDLLYIDARIQHVHRDRDLRKTSRLVEIVDQVLHIVCVVIDHAREVPAPLREQLVKPLHDKLRVLVVARKDDRLAQLVAALYALPLLHQVNKHLVYGVLVEQPCVERVRVDPWRKVVRRFGIAELLLVLLLLFL